MKQIVDFEQAKRLAECDIYIKHCQSVVIKNGGYFHQELPCTPHYKAPTIGELIEWIWENTNMMVEIDNRASAKGIVAVQWGFGEYNYEGFELIDALVELAIKIKEEHEDLQ